MNILSSPNVHLRAWSQFSRRAALGLAVGAALGGVGLAAKFAAASEPKTPRANILAAVPARRRRRRRPRYKVVTRTFRNASPILLSDESPATPYPSVITVAGLKHGKLLDLNVTLSGFNHEWTPDVDLLLVAPNGRSAVIMSDVGPTTEVNNATVVIDDQASTPLSFGSVVSGRFQPGNDEGLEDSFPSWPGASTPNIALATFNGINPNGAWKLYLVDDSSGDVGFIIGGWALTIKARIRV